MSKPEAQQQAQQQAPQHKPAVEQEHGKLKNVGDIHPFQAADKPYPLPEDLPDCAPWEKAEFKRRVLEAGFPGSPASDGAFLAALYKFAGGKSEDSASGKPEKK